MDDRAKKITDSLARSVLFIFVLLATQLVWELFYLAYVPELTEQRDSAGLAASVLAGYLLEFTIGWQSNFLIWTWVTGGAVVFSVWSIFRNKRAACTACTTLFLALNLFGTVCLLAAKTILETK